MKPEWFAARLKELRKAKKWSQQTLAEESGVSLGTIRALEQEAYGPTWETVLSLCKALGVTCEAFTEEPADAPKPKRGRPAKGTVDATEEAKPKKRARKKKGDA